MSTLLNIVEAIVLFVAGIVPAIVADVQRNRQPLPMDWTARQQGSASVGFVMFMAFMVLVGLVLVLAMQSGAFAGGTGSVAPACFTPGGIQVVCG